jgi:hypothetical protein
VSQLIPLADLESQTAWNARTDALAYFEYYEASEAVRLLRLDVGVAGTVLILDLLRQGVSFDAAFFAVTGQTAGAFEAAFPSRLRAIGTTPAVLIAADTPVGTGLSYTAYGFTPFASLTIRITLADYGTYTSTGSADTYGVYSKYLTVAGGWPVGNYTIAVTDGTRTASATGSLTG